MCAVYMLHWSVITSTLAIQTEIYQKKNGFKVYLCQEHHRGTLGVHGKLGHALDIRLKQDCEKKYILRGHTKEEFIKLIR